MTTTALNRRRFMISASVVAGGMTFGIGKADAASKGPWAPEQASGFEFSPWIEIRPDDAVIVRVPTPEIGNGAMTQVAMNVAEELGCAWRHVRAEYCSIRRNHLENGVYSVGRNGFFGGHSTDHVRMRHALQLGASARERLKAAAAARWGVPVTEVEVKDSLLRHPFSGRSLRFGEVISAAAKVTLSAEPALKPRSEWTLLGKTSPGKLHTPQIVTGEAIFGIDVKLTGMVHAALLQSPVQGGRLKSHKPDMVLKMPGVRAVVVIDPAKTRGSPVASKATFGLGDSLAQSGVAVIADHFWQAKTALEALPVEWEPGAGANWNSSEQLAAAALAQIGKGLARELRKTGDIAAAKGKRIVEGDYSTPYADNAPLEPLNATALVTADSAEVWCPTQDMQQAYWVAIDETGLPPEKVALHPTYVGGGFGRRTQADDVRMAVAIARQYPGVPVKTIWTREEMFRQGRYRVPIVTRFKAVLDDATGLPEALEAQACFTGNSPAAQLPLGFSDMPYFNSGIIPGLNLTSTSLPAHLLVGAYRGPSYNSHAFIVETFIDECAVAAGIDPLEYRLTLLGTFDPAWSKCLQVASAKAGWGTSLPKGEGLGIAISGWPVLGKPQSGTIVCTAARVSVSKAGVLTIARLDVAFDCGNVANPDAVRAQVEGGTIFGINMTLNEEITITDGAVVEGNFDTYPMQRMADVPPVHVHFDAISGHERMDIAGEAPVGPVGPAIGNAIFQATGKRLRSTPFRKHDLGWS